MLAETSSTVACAICQAVSSAASSGHGDASSSPLLLLDEPTAGRPDTRDALLAVVRAAAGDGAAVVYTTHYLPELDTLEATVAVADHGRIIARGDRAQLLATVPGHELRPPTLDDFYRHVRMSCLPAIRLAAEDRHQRVLLARDPGPMIGYAVMGLLLITVTRPLYAALGRLLPGSEQADRRAAAGMAVMFRSSPSRSAPRTC